MITGRARRGGMFGAWLLGGAVLGCGLLAVTLGGCPAEEVPVLSPASGPSSGGTKVLIRGQGFDNRLAVLFGEARVDRYERVNDYVVEVVTPAGEPGMTDVTLVRGDGREQVLSGAFEYLEAEEPTRPAPVTLAAVSPSVGTTLGGTEVTVRGANLQDGSRVLFGDFLATDVEFVSKSLLKVKTPARSSGLVDVSVIPVEGETATLAGAFEYLSKLEDIPLLEQQFPGAPRVVSAVSTSNTSVLITFSEPVKSGGGEASNYSIVQANVNPEAGALAVLGGVLGADQTTVMLTTRAQSEVTYVVTVTNVQDIAGNPLAAPGTVVNGVLVDPTRAEFAGTPPGDAALDSDGDGLSDAAEQKGWKVTIKLTNGTVSERDVTSDPDRADTDGDGLDDATEKNIAIDPRSGDSDGDQVPDAAEWNEWFSEPAEQDTDGDGFADSVDLAFGTSPTLQDTDGDQWSDFEEIIERNRNPRLADLPLPQVLVGEARLTLDVRSSYTDETGTTQVVEDTVTTSFARSEEQSFGRSDTTSNETILEFGQTIGFEAGYESGVPSFKGSFEASFGQTLANGFTSTVSSESSQAATEEYQNSVSRVFEQSENRSVTRTVEGAAIITDVSIQNLSNISFAITNVELSVLQQDRRNANRFIPVAALRLEGADDPNDQPTFNLGPYEERGPFIFVNEGVFPALVEDLLREPQGLVYRVVNFDLLDEFGRNFVFSSQEVNDRTVGITIDFGDGVVEDYRVATNNKFGADGRMIPLRMEAALALVGLMPDPNGDTPNADPDDPQIQGTYGTEVDGGVEILTRVRGVQSSYPDPNEAPRFWAIISSNRRVPETVDFRDIELRARDSFLLVYTRDQDRDLLLEREEIFYGSSDTSVDTDNDTLSDYDEVREGWLVTVLGRGVERVFSSPAAADTDFDGLSDADEQVYGTDPTKRDTDFDGLTDPTEIFGPLQIVLFDGDNDSSNNPVLFVPRYEDEEVIVTGFDGVCDTAALGDDEQVVPVGDLAAQGAIVVRPGANGEIDSVPGSIAVPPLGDDYIRVSHGQEVVTSPLNPDTDFDGIPDGREPFLGVNPNRDDAAEVIDSDNDGLSDAEETRGWVVVVNGGAPEPVTSDVFSPDTDRDGIPDVYERAIGTNPRSRDTDADGLFDYREFDINDELGIYDGLAIAEAGDRCADATACSFEPADGPLLIGTDPREADTDGDGRDDPVELNESWFVDTYSGDPYEVFSDPKVADEDQDGLNDSGEFDAGSDPEDPDTDGDRRSDGDEISDGLDPLRQDFTLKVEITTVDVIGDCDAATCEGLEMQGTFSLRKPDGTDVTLYTEHCKTEECACEVRDCCDSSKCEGEAFEFYASTSFVFREGESIRLFTNSLKDNDDFFCPPGGLEDTIGSFSQDFNFTVPFQASFSRDIGGGGCFVRANYVFTVLD